MAVCINGHIFHKNKCILCEDQKRRDSTESKEYMKAYNKKKWKEQKSKREGKIK